MHGLIDTTEMYLRTIFELEEEGIVPLRARIAERLSQSGPTVSQTVARMERDGLVKVEGDRQLALTDAGRTLAMRVMRKHRLAECLLVGVIGLPWEEVHVEACRWEHVISENVERQAGAAAGLPGLLPARQHHPRAGRARRAATDTQQRAEAAGQEQAEAMTAVAASLAAPVTVRRISEQVQSDPSLMLKLKRIGIQPGREVTLAASDDGVRVTSEDRVGSVTAELPRLVAPTSSSPGAEGGPGD